MSQHQGQTVERLLRREGHSLSEVARLLNVNRRSLYNWFNQAVLKQEIIYKIGHVMMHDFSVEFPEHFKPADFVFKNKPSASLEDYKIKQPLQQASQESPLWRERYMELYPSYKILLDRVFKKNIPPSIFNQ
jgi:hypothetical protein